MILDFLFRASASDKERILTSADLERYLAGRNKSAAGVNVTLDRAMKFATFFACVRVLAESIGQLPLHLFKQEGRGTEKALEHPLYSLLHDAPNDLQTSQEFLEWVVASLAIRGNAYAHINRVRGKVMEIVPFTGSVQPKVNQQTRALTYLVDVGGMQEEIGSTEVLHIKLFSLDGIVGLSPLGYARETLGMGIASEQHGAGLFANGAQPSGTLETDKTLSEAAAKRLKTSFEERYAGSENAGSTVVLEEGLKWKQVTMSSADAEWLAGRKFTRSELCGLMRVPPHMIADLERATFSNIEHSSIDFVVHSLTPYCTRIEQRTKLQLLNKNERAQYFARFNVDGLLRGDSKSRAEYMKTAIGNGWMSPNEARELENRNPRPGGDSFLTPANMLIDGKAPPSAEKPVAAPGKEPGGDPPAEDE